MRFAPWFLCFVLVALWSATGCEAGWLKKHVFKPIEKTFRKERDKVIDVVVPSKRETRTVEVFQLGTPEYTINGAGAVSIVSGDDCTSKLRESGLPENDAADACNLDILHSRTTHETFKAIGSNSHRLLRLEVASSDEGSGTKVVRWLAVTSTVPVVSKTVEYTRKTKKILGLVKIQDREFESGSVPSLDANEIEQIRSALAAKAVEGIKAAASKLPYDEL